PLHLPRYQLDRKVAAALHYAQSGYRVVLVIIDDDVWVYDLDPCIGSQGRARRAAPGKLFEPAQCGPEFACITAGDGMSRPLVQISKNVAQIPLRWLAKQDLRHQRLTDARCASMLAMASSSDRTSPRATAARASST